MAQFIAAPRATSLRGERLKPEDVESSMLDLVGPMGVGAVTRKIVDGLVGKGAKALGQTADTILKTISDIIPAVIKKARTAPTVDPGLQLGDTVKEVRRMINQVVSKPTGVTDREFLAMLAELSKTNPEAVRALEEVSGLPLRRNVRKEFVTLVPKKK